jgi:aryl-alcohol dehydrogenase-like predicted oxidoreductase
VSATGEQETTMTQLPRRTLGDSGIEVPVVGIGCNNFGRRIDYQRTELVVHAALSEGVGFFDTADFYGDGASEEFIGRALHGRRDEAVIATKFGMPMPGGDDRRGGSRRWITRAIEDSLRRLRTDHIDLYQHHEPDQATPVEETLETLDELVAQGKVRAIGCSNYSGAQIEAADAIARERGLARYVTAQNHYNLLERDPVESDVTPACSQLGLGILPFFPLANGLLTGKYHRGSPPPPGTRLAGNPLRAGELMTDRNLGIVEALERVAEQRGLTLVDVAIGGLAAQAQVVSVIAGATSPEQVRANAAAGRWTPSDDDLAEIDRITRAS